jgi:hypothetical protein
MILAWTFVGLLGSLCVLLMFNKEYTNYQSRKYNRKDWIRMKYRHKRHSKNQYKKYTQENKDSGL